MNAKASRIAFFVPPPLYLVYLAQSLDCAPGKDKAEPSDHANELTI